MDLVKAIEHQNEKLALDIIERGTDVNYMKDTISPILIFAIHKRRLNVVNKLIDKKADIHATDIYGTSAIRFAAFYEMEQLVIRLINLGANVQSKNKYSASALEAIVKKNSTVIINHLKFMYLNSLLEILNDYSSIISKCFSNNGDLNILDMINDYLQIDYSTYK